MMKKIWIILIISFFTVTSTLSQFKSDSLVRFSDLTYHSEFEKQSVSDFLNNEKDPFNLYLSINEEITFKEAIDFRNKYFKIYNDLKERNVESKKINKKIKITYSTVHSRFPKKYLSTEYFPAIFNGGTYNCVSATMLYSLVFDSISIPYKVMVSSDHVYLVANPGPKSIVIETTNPSFENAIFTGEFKQQYVNYLRNSNLISSLIHLHSVPISRRN